MDSYRRHGWEVMTQVLSRADRAIREVKDIQVIM